MGSSGVRKDPTLAARFPVRVEVGRFGFPTRAEGWQNLKDGLRTLKSPKVLLGVVSANLLLLLLYRSLPPEGQDYLRAGWPGPTVLIVNIAAERARRARDVDSGQR